jgi:hypothetical protein
MTEANAIRDPRRPTVLIIYTSPLELGSALSREPIVKRTAALLHEILLLGTRLCGCYVKLTFAVWRLPDGKPLERLTMCNSSITNPELL